MTVTRIEPFSRGKGRVAIYLNNQFAFVLYKGELSTYAIEEGMELSDELYTRILDETIILRAKKRAMNLLLKMDRTESDVRNKLSEGGYPAEAIEAAIDYLKSFHYLDDYRYASEYIRIKSSSMSSRVIRQKLVEKGISKTIIEDAFNEQDAQEQTNQEMELIRQLIIKRSKGSDLAPDYREKQKLYAYLYNKGFSVENIDKVYNEYYNS